MPEAGGIQLPAEAQQALMQMQTFQQKYQAISMQKEAMTLQKLDTDKALEELGKLNDGDEAYKAVGPILVKASKTELEKELTDKNEMVGIRLKSLEKEEVELREKLKGVQEKLQAVLGTGSGKAE